MSTTVSVSGNSNTVTSNGTSGTIAVSPAPTVTVDVTTGGGSGSGSPGATGPTGPTGPSGPSGPSGEGVPAGGTTGQVLAKASGTDYDTEWVAGGAGGSTFTDGIDVTSTNTNTTFNVTNVSTIARTDDPGSGDYALSNVNGGVANFEAYSAGSGQTSSVSVAGSGASISAMGVNNASMALNNGNISASANSIALVQSANEAAVWMDDTVVSSEFLSATEGTSYSRVTPGSVEMDSADLTATSHGYVRATAMTSVEIGHVDPTGSSTVTFAGENATVNATNIALNGVLSVNAVPHIPVPDPTGETGKVLGTDGTNVSWVSPTAGTFPAQTGNAGKVLTTDGTDPSWSTTVTGDYLIQSPSNDMYQTVTDVWVKSGARVGDAHSEITLVSEGLLIQSTDDATGNASQLSVGTTSASLTYAASDNWRSNQINMTGSSVRFFGPELRFNNSPLLSGTKLGPAPTNMYTLTGSAHPDDTITVEPGATSLIEHTTGETYWAATLDTGAGLEGYIGAHYPDGHQEWAYRIDCGANESVKAIALDLENSGYMFALAHDSANASVTVVGMWISANDASIDWQSEYAVDEIHDPKMHLTPDGHLLIAFRNVTTGGDSEYHVASINRFNGTVAWAKKFTQTTSPNEVTGLHLTDAPDGAVWCVVTTATPQTGIYKITTEFGDIEALDVYPFEATSAAGDQKGALYLAAGTDLYRFDNLNPIWKRQSHYPITAMAPGTEDTGGVWILCTYDPTATGVDKAFVGRVNASGSVVMATSIIPTTTAADPELHPYCLSARRVGMPLVGIGMDQRMIFARVPNPYPGYPTQGSMFVDDTMVFDTATNASTTLGSNPVGGSTEFATASASVTRTTGSATLVEAANVVFGGPSVVG